MARTVKQYDLELVEGADFDETITWTIDGDAVDLTDYTAELRIGTSGSTDLTLDDTDGLTLGDDGTILVQVTDTQTDALPDGRLYYELDVTDGDGIVTRLLNGRANVTRRVAS